MSSRVEEGHLTFPSCFSFAEAICGIGRPFAPSAKRSALECLCLIWVSRWRNLIGKGEMGIKDETKIVSWGWGTDWSTITEGKCSLWILFNWGLRPSNRNSVLALLKQRRFEVIQSAMALRAVCKQEIFSLNLVGWKDMNNWVSSAYRWWLSENEEISEVRGVVYSEKSRGPSTEPWVHHSS